MGWSEPEKCCCCCQLRTGCLVIGYLGLISCSLLVLVVAISLGSEPVVVEDEDGKSWVVPTWILVLAMILETFFALVYACLLIGVYTKRPHLVRAAYIALGTLGIIFTIQNFCDPSRQNAPGIIGIIIGFAINCYLILCIRAYSLTMMDEQSVNQGVV